MLPSSVPQHPKGAVCRPDGWWIPIFCANCGADGGLVPEYGLPVDGKVWAFYLCNACGETWGALAAHTFVEPMIAFWQRVCEVQQEEYGHLLSQQELVAAVATKQSPMAKLAREVSSP